MTTSQVDKFVTGNQPQITDSKIYSGGPIAPHAGGARHTRQPPITGHKIYSSQPVPTIAVRLKASGDQVLINKEDFDAAVHEGVE